MSRYPLFPPTVPGTVGESPAQGRGTIGERGIVGEERLLKRKEGNHFSLRNWLKV
jgi:hypothetical protein